MISVVRRVLGTLLAGLRPKRRKMALPGWARSGDPPIERRR
jgi:hypothetical protein